VAVASAGPYASLHLQTDNHASTPPLSFFTGRMPFLPPNQKHQSTEGKLIKLFSRVSRYQKGKTNLDFTEARDSEWQWHQLDHTASRNKQNVMIVWFGLSKV